MVGRRWLAIGVLSAAISACVEQDSQTLINTGGVDSDRSFNWNIPANYPLPVVHADNPISEEKFQLGRHLFYDQRLSGLANFSCASCHRQELAFTDGLAQAIGATGQKHPRSAQALVNIAYNASVNWGNPTTVTLEQQAPIPLFNEFPVEMGVNDSNQAQVLARLQAEPRYRGLFKAAFPNEAQPIHFANVAKALASFERGLNSFNSPFDQYEAGNQFAIDQYEAGNQFAITAAAKRGMQLFFDEKTECFHCHGGMNFSLSSFDRSQSFADTEFFNNGLYNLDGKGKYPDGGEGIFEITGKPEDMGRFRPPTLRNIALTAPYMHDGSIESLDAVIRHYMGGGRTITTGLNAGDGRANPYKSGFVRPFDLTEQEITDLREFLESLTDESFINNPRFASPWE